MGNVKTSYANDDYKNFTFHINEAFFPINLYLNGKLQICNQDNIDDFVLSVINSDIVDVSAYDPTLFCHAGIITFKLDSLYDKDLKFHNAPILVPMDFECNYFKLLFTVINGQNTIIGYQSTYDSITDSWIEVLNPLIGQHFLQYGNYFYYQFHQFHLKVFQDTFNDDFLLYLNIDRNEVKCAEKFTFGDNYLFSPRVLISNYPFYDIKNPPF